MAMVTPPIDAAQLAQDAFRDLDRRQLAIFAKQSPTQRLQLMFDLCRFAQQMIIATEQARNPNITADELARRVRARIEISYGA